MEIHGSLIFYHIKKKYPSAFCSLSRDYRVKGPVLPESADRMKGNLVAVDRNISIHNTSFIPDVIFLYAGYSKEELSGDLNDYIAIPEHVPFPEIFNHVLEIFSMFLEFEHKLEAAVNTKYSYSAILSSCEDLFDGPYALLDTQFRYVGYSKQMANASGFEEKYVGENNYLPLDEINQLNAMPDFNKLEQLEDVFQYVCVENMLHKNIHYHGRFVGRLAIPWSKEDYVNDYNVQLLLIVSEYIEKLYDKTGTFRKEERLDTHFKEAMEKLLNGEKLEHDVLTHLLSSRNYKQNDTYRLIRFSSDFTNSQNDTISALAARLEGLWPGTCCLFFCSCFFALVNLTEFERVCETSFNNELACFLRESLLKAGLSRRFTDLFTLRSAYRQTEIALSEGPLIDQTYWYFKFDDYIFGYMLKHGYGDFLPEQVCHKGILKLISYDRENNTQLNHTLKTYIRLQYNAVAAAGELFIARSSFLKRMDRIEKLTHIDLTDFNERLYLALSYAIFDKFEHPENL